MSRIPETVFPWGNTDLEAVVRHYPEQILCGTKFRDAGWFWHWRAYDPDGNALVGVSKGPFPTEEAACADLVGQLSPAIAKAKS